MYNFSPLKKHYEDENSSNLQDIDEEVMNDVRIHLKVIKYLKVFKGNTYILLIQF